MWYLIASAAALDPPFRPRTDAAGGLGK